MWYTLHMPNRRYTDQELIEAVNSSTGIRQVLSKLGLRPTGGNYKVFHSNVDRLKLDTSHFSGQGWRSGSTTPVVKPRPLEEVLVKNSPHKNTFSLKTRLIREGVFEEVCSECGLVEWNGKKIPLELEHINGKNNDNRIENLTLLCPNCHALTPTYRGKNKNQAELVE